MEQQKRILIAEDERPLASALSIKLQKEGYAVDTAFDGDEVKDAVAKGGYSIILMDLMMPKHDAYAVMQEMKDRGDITPVVVLSNMSQDTERNRSTLAGALHYFIKSDISLTDVVSFVRKTIN